MLTLEKIINQRDMFRARVELMRMLTELSDDALEYVWRPIAYAWHHSDQNDPDVMTDDDMKRMLLIIAVAHDKPDVIYTVVMNLRSIYWAEWEASREAGGVHRE